MNVGPEENGLRNCPACGAPEEIDSGGKLWPQDWRCRTRGFAAAKANDVTLLAPGLDDGHEGFDLSTFEPLVQVENDRFWFISRNELFGWLVERHLPEARRLLEMGCCTGFVIQALRQALPRAHIAASEPHGVGLAEARARDKVGLLQMATRNSGMSKALGVVGMFGAIEASTACFEPIYQSSFTVVAFLLMVSSWLVARLKIAPRTLEEQTDAKYRTSPGVARVMLGLARFEHALRKHHVPMPFGGSQILVAQRPRQ